jgi:hypothetical protein
MAQLARLKAASEVAHGKSAALGHLEATASPPQRATGVCIALPSHKPAAVAPLRGLLRVNRATTHPGLRGLALGYTASPAARAIDKLKFAEQSD